MKERIRKILSIYIIFLTLVTPSLLLGKINAAQGANPEPFFKIYILVPNSHSTSRMYWHLEDNLPKIGIDIGSIVTGWAQISPRTWGYQGPYPIPSYNQSGYDMLNLAWCWDLEYDPTGLYDTPSIVPNGDNFYQYSNPEMDQAIANYAVAFNDTDKIELVDTIQKLLYDDLPTLGLHYSMSTYPHKEGFTGWDGLLWASKYQPMENWSITEQNDFIYATPAEFEDFHPFFAQSCYDHQWLNQIYNGLIQRQPGNHLWGNRVASSYTSSDNLNWTIEINPNAVWADGTSITADDVIYSYQLAVNPNITSYSYSQYNSWWDNDSLIKINDKELRISFKQQSIFQERNLALQLIPKHIWSAIAPENHSIQALDWMITNPENIFGAGPYMLEDYNATNGVIHLVTNPHFTDWYGADPSFDDIYFEYYSSKEGALAALTAGSVDMVDAQFSPQLDELNIVGITYTLVKEPVIHEIAINMEHPWIGTGELCPIAGVESAKHIRYAISHCMDREYYAENQFNYGVCIPAATSVPSVAIGFNESYIPFSFNLTKAREHMLLAGFDYKEGNNSYVIGDSLAIMYISTIFTSWVIIQKKEMNK